MVLQDQPIVISSVMIRSVRSKRPKINDVYQNNDDEIMNCLIHTLTSY